MTHDVKHDLEGNPILQRYTPNERTNHWITAICFILLALSGLGMFHPVTAWLTVFFGGGQAARFIHPFLGIVMFASFMVTVVRFWHHNRFEEGDKQWLMQVQDVMANREDKLPKVGRYNAGQKMLFFTLVVCMLFLFATGIVIWRQFFAMYFPIELIRLAALAHAFFAFVIIMAIIVHVYAGIWVKGSMGAMVRGWVTYGWAKKHHPRWFEEEVKKQGQ